MTTREMLVFCGSVLGPVLIAQAVVELLREVPAPQRRPLTPTRAPIGPPRAEADVDRILRRAFPRGLDL